MSLVVKIVSLLLTLSIFLFAALHVAYLVAAFDLRDQAGRNNLPKADKNLKCNFQIQLLQKASTGELEDSSYQVNLVQVDK